MSTHQLPTIPNFPELEHKWLAFWEKENIVQQYLHKNDSSDKRFSFIDGPITAQCKVMLAEAEFDMKTLGEMPELFY